MKQCIVVIPIYKQLPDSSEFASFRQVLKVLHQHDIALVTFRELDIAVYLNEARKLGKLLNIEYFDSSYFSSVTGYNRLCLDASFYKRFLSYEYMLIYQLDAWVFRDELEYWCNQGYDYIGAPWFTNYGGYEDGDKLWYVGNGGFSLRKNAFLYQLLSYKWPLSCHIDLKNGLKGLFKSLLKSMGYHNTIKWHIETDFQFINEDRFFTNHIKNISNKTFLYPTTPSVEVAAKFSFEKSPSYLYQLCGNRLPFGCHAFMKCEYESFWKEYIKIDE